MMTPCEVLLDGDAIWHQGVERPSPSSSRHEDRASETPMTTKSWQGALSCVHAYQVMARCAYLCACMLIFVHRCHVVTDVQQTMTMSGQRSSLENAARPQAKRDPKGTVAEKERGLERCSHKSDT